MKDLTDKNFWSSYWDNKQIAKSISPHYPFSDLFKKLLLKRTRATALEVGGFPGYFAIFFHKYWGYRPTLLDYHLNQKELTKLWRANDIPTGTIEIIKADFLTYSTRRRFDLVFSLGFLEHFASSADIIKRHWRLVKRGGEMLIVIPNFLGLNGAFQLWFDSDNFTKHNLIVMDPGALRTNLQQLGIKRVKVFYWGGLRVWLENLSSRAPLVKFLVYSLCGLGLLVNALGINNRFLSPYLVIYAKKS